MAQKYKLSFYKGNIDKSGCVRIYIRIMPQNIKLATPIKIEPKYWGSQKVIKSPRAAQLNSILNKIKHETEGKILTLINAGQKISKENLSDKNGADFESFVLKHIDLHTGKFSDGRINHLKSCLSFLLEYRPKLTFTDIDTEFLQSFEKWIRDGREGSTILTKMSTVLSFVNAAEKKGLIEKKQYSAYKRPSAKRKIPIYLTEDQIKSFYEVVQPLKNEFKKSTGYYFLLSCYTGYRISDCKAFNYDKSVKGNTIAIRAKKNGNIVSSPIYSPIDEILEYCKEHPFIEYEQDARETVKEICKDAGIPFPNLVKFHSGRHTFAMMWVKRGLPIDDVAELLGDSRDVAEIYARIENTDLQKKMLDKIK